MGLHGRVARGSAVLNGRRRIPDPSRLPVSLLHFSLTSRASARRNPEDHDAQQNPVVPERLEAASLEVTNEHGDDGPRDEEGDDETDDEARDAHVLHEIVARLVALV